MAVVGGDHPAKFSLVAYMYRCAGIEEYARCHCKYTNPYESTSGIKSGSCFTASSETSWTCCGVTARRKKQSVQCCIDEIACTCGKCSSFMRWHVAWRFIKYVLSWAFKYRSFLWLASLERDARRWATKRQQPVYKNTRVDRLKRLVPAVEKTVAWHVTLCYPMGRG